MFKIDCEHLIPKIFKSVAIYKVVLSHESGTIETNGLCQEPSLLGVWPWHCYVDVNVSLSRGNWSDFTDSDQAYLYFASGCGGLAVISTATCIIYSSVSPLKLVRIDLTQNGKV